MTKPCSYPGCNTHLSRYNDGECCAEHEVYNEIARAGMHMGKVPEEEPEKSRKAT